MNEELNIRPVARSHVDVDRKASREYIFGKKKESPKARCCKCGTECDCWDGEDGDDYMCDKDAVFAWFEIPEVSPEIKQLFKSK